MIKNIFTGIRAYGGAFKLIGQLGLWKYFGVPMFISFITAILIGFAAWGLPIILVVLFPKFGFGNGELKLSEP